MIGKPVVAPGRRDEKPGIDLALELLESKNFSGIEIIQDGLTRRDNHIANDCIKVDISITVLPVLA